MSAPGSRLRVCPPAETAGKDSWYVYIVRCSDDTLYTGITRNLEKRIQEHNCGPKGARYTRARRPVALVYFEPATSRSTATSREYHIKKLNISQKCQLMTEKEMQSRSFHDINPDC